MSERAASGLRRAAVVVVLLLAARRPLLAQDRLSSDFEITQMQQQLQRAHDFDSQLSARLNLGDARVARNEPALARDEYTKALELAAKERVDAYNAKALRRYAHATAFAGLAAAKLGDEERAWSLFDDALRYASDLASIWNVYSSALLRLHQDAKAVSASRNAVALAQRDLAREATTDNRIDLYVYEYTLAAVVNDPRESEELLLDVVAALESPAFALLRGQVRRAEHFESYATPMGNVAAYVSLLNRSRLRLAKLYESRDDFATANAQYEKVLEARSDDPTALAGLSRFKEAFDANPFSLPLIRAYQQRLRTMHDEVIEGTSSGAQMRRALMQIERGELADARATLDALAAKFPRNDTIAQLQREIGAAIAPPSFLGQKEVIDPTEHDLRSTLALANTFTPEQRARLDAITFTSKIVFDKPFESGRVNGVPFSFSEPMHFNGNFDATKPLRLTYRILGATKRDGDAALLLEPVRLQ